METTHLLPLNQLTHLNEEGEDSALIHYINELLFNAFSNGVSDLHFEPYEKNYRIRFRQDGILYEKASAPIQLAPRFAARLKVLAKLDISERRMPQEGCFKISIAGDRSVEFRMSTCPTLYGEKIVLRVSDPSLSTLGINALGFEDFQKNLFLQAIGKPQGMVLVTGPTGSGKTLTLYTALHLLNIEQRNILTCEDPVEVNIPGINQVHVNSKIGLNFASVLRVFLRQDPDVIMLGEIRDLETAEIAVKAAFTGHLVLSTLHTNSALESLTRLLNIGIPAYNIASALSLVVAQRLVRLLCAKCKVMQILPQKVLLDLSFSLDEIPHLNIYAPKGCEYCNKGYKGRIGIFEVLPMTQLLSGKMMSGMTAFTLQQEALAEGMWTLRQAGLQKVKQGLTSIEEIMRIT